MSVPSGRLSEVSSHENFAGDHDDAMVIMKKDEIYSYRKDFGCP